jgi:ornithine cyclodeaminase/alanine dehydrogenase-like protein (mu-crystallin family)
MRVGADSGIGVRYMARKNAEVVGMIGSGGMARSHIEAFLQARPIRRLQVYSPTKEHREAYAVEVRERFEIDAVAVDTAEEAHRGADIVAGCTDAVVPVVFGRFLDPGTHVTCVGGRLDDDVYEKIDVSLRLGSAPAPLGMEDMALHDETIAYAARPDHFRGENRGGRAHGVVLEDRVVFLQELLNGQKLGRTVDDQITYSARGNVQGLQFFSVAGAAYEACKAQGLGRELPTEWFLQDIRD